MNPITTNSLEAISLNALVTVTGGADQGTPPPSDIFKDGAGPNRTEVTGNITAQTPAVSASGNGAYRSSSSNYTECLKANTGLKGAALAEACGKPGN